MGFQCGIECALVIESKYRGIGVAQPLAAAAMPAMAAAVSIR